MPIGHGLHIGKKLRQRRRAHAGLAIAARAGTVAVHDALGQGVQTRGIGQELGGVKNAIAIQGHGVQIGQPSLHLPQADRAAVRLPGQRQNALGFGVHGGTRFVIDVDAGQRQHVCPTGENLGIAHMGNRPLARGQQLGGTDAAIAVVINDIEGGGVKLHATCGAGQGHPQLLVQLCQVGNIGPGANHDLVHAPGANKLPSVLLCLHSVVQPLCPVAPCCPAAAAHSGGGN